MYIDEMSNHMSAANSFDSADIYIIYIIIIFHSSDIFPYISLLKFRAFERLWTHRWSESYGSLGETTY